MSLKRSISTDLSFNGHDFSQIDAAGQPCITMAEAASVLYGKGGQTVLPFEKPASAGDKALQKVYQRHADEFSEGMTSMVKMQTAGGTQMVRVFSLRGCNLLAMFARTPMAKQFRRWALDAIERREKEAGETLPMLYTALAEYTSSKAIDDLLAIVQPSRFNGTFH